MKFKEKNILITGSSSGIGRALAVEFAKNGANLFLIARRKEKLEELKNELKVFNINIQIYKCDVSVKEEVNKAVDSALTFFTKIDIAILNAAVGHKNFMINVNSDLAESTFKINYMSIVYFVEFLLPNLKINKNSIIVGVSSLADNRAYPESVFYCSVKSAVTLLLEGMRIELEEEGVKVITVKPGFVKTEMIASNNFKMPFIMDPQQAAKIIVAGIKKEKSLIQFPMPTVIGAKLIGALPNKFAEYLLRYFYKERDKK